MATRRLERSSEKKLWQTSSRMLRIAQKDWNCEQSFMTLHKSTGRATPKMWSNYVKCCALFDVVVNKKPNTFFFKLMENNLVEQRFEGLIFTRTNRLKIGLNCLSNRLMYVSRQLNFNWLMCAKATSKVRCKTRMIRNALDI
jgi:hypothetical protein